MEIAQPISTLLDYKKGTLWSITPDATVYEAIELMADKNIGALPVMEGDRLEGLISEREYSREVILKERSSKTTVVRDVMLAEVPCVTPGDDIRSAMELMTRNRVRHLPVMQGGKVVDIVSIGDLVNWIISSQDSLIQQLENYIRGAYPA